MKLKCLIVDDEPIAREIISQYCSYLPELEVTGSCKSALEAKRIIEKSPVNLIFLDINMPVLDGLSFLKTLNNPPEIILTTAYKEYAHEAFDLAVCDYLLKPFSIERFIIAIDKVKDKLSFSTAPVTQQISEQHCFIKSEGKIYKINYEEVMYAEADGNYVKIVSDKGIIRPAITFNTLENLLPKSYFVRLHRSFIINKNRVTHIEGNRAFIGAREIPIGTNYKEFFFREMGIR